MTQCLNPKEMCTSLTDIYFSAFNISSICDMNIIMMLWDNVAEVLTQKYISWLGNSATYLLNNLLLGFESE